MTLDKKNAESMKLNVTYFEMHNIPYSILERVIKFCMDEYVSGGEVREMQCILKSIGMILERGLDDLRY